jgi:hypothetical protein
MASPNRIVTEPNASERDRSDVYGCVASGRCAGARSVMYSRSNEGIGTASGASVNSGFARAPV